MHKSSICFGCSSVPDGWVYVSLLRCSTDRFGSGGPGQAWSIHAATFDHKTHPRDVVLEAAVTSRQQTNPEVQFLCCFVLLSHLARTNDVGPKPATVGGGAGQWAHAPTHQLSVTSPLSLFPFRSPQANLTDVHPPPSPPKRTLRLRLNPNARATMRSSPLAILSSVLACANVATASDMIADNRIKVQLFAAPAFFSEVSVDAYNNQCLSLDNNL
jgi:hypothetical protein